MESVTVLRPDGERERVLGQSGVLPADMLEQVRRRVRMLGLILAAAFGFDAVIYLVQVGTAAVRGTPVPADHAGGVGLVNLSSTLASLALAWCAQGKRVSSDRLLTLGLIYEVLISFVVALLNYSFYYTNGGTVPTLTWVPVIIIAFPLILPGPPARMLTAAIAAAAMPVLALLVLRFSGQISPATDILDAYAQATVSSAFAVTFAWFGARLIYGLGKEISAARELGAYRLEEKLGEGGMGEVWRARHRMLVRPAAIKLMRPTIAATADPAIRAEVLQRFEREAQAIAQLSSPHTVQLFDFGIANDGALYYAMELLHGLDADRFVRRFGPMPVERAVHLLTQACHSLSEAEARGLVHRDIKPANIFLCRYGEDYDFVKVLDFGLVKALDAPELPDQKLSVEQHIRGTPAFIAPEQALGQENIDHRADLYALGCVGYWLVTGQLVFTADTPMAVMVQHARMPPTPPSSRTELPIPPELDAVILACLEKDPASRPQSARELSQRLAAVPVGRVWNEEAAQAWWESHGLT